MDTQLYYVDRTSDTSADTLLAVGFAVLAREILLKCKKKSKGISIRNVGPYYEINLPTPISTDDLQKLEKHLSLIQFLESKKLIEKQAKQGKPIEEPGFPYDVQLQKSKAYYEKRKLLPPHLRGPEALLKRKTDPLIEEIERQAPDAKLGHYQAIYQMKIASSFNDLALRWIRLTSEQQYFHVNILLTLFSSLDNDIASAIAKWQKLAKEQNLEGEALVTALQIVNPTTGKGANRTKASELAIGNQDSFWLLELLKFVGFMRAAVPFTIQESKDRKTYVLQPKHVELSTLEGIMNDFRKVCWSSTVIKLDILASLRFAQTFAEHRLRSLEAEADSDLLEEKGIFSLAQGFETIFYKDMGSAYATMNIATINLPEWLRKIENQTDAEVASTLLEEHLQLIQGIQDGRGKEGSEEYELLRFYRDFLSGNDLRPFWKFTTAYSSYLMSARDKGRYVHQLTTSGLEKLIMSTQDDDINLTDISRDDAFKRIASAIRQSTVTAQRQQLKDRTYPYKARYGLGQELKRKAQYRKEFMEALSLFLQQYNEETAREEERAAKLPPEERSKRKRRSYVTEADLNGIETLIDKYGSSLICSMLIAHGYALDVPKDSDTTVRTTKRAEQTASSQEE